MAIDKSVDSALLDAAMSYEAGKIRTKLGSSAQVNYDLANGKGFGDAIDAIPTGGSFQNISILVKNGRASGSISFGFPNYNASVEAVCVNTVSVSVESSSTINMLDQSGVIGFNLNQVISQVSYDGTDLPFAIAGSGSSRKVRVTLPSNYDNTIPMVFS